MAFIRQLAGISAVVLAALIGYALYGAAVAIHCVVYPLELNDLCWSDIKHPYAMALGFVPVAALVFLILVSALGQHEMEQADEPDPSDWGGE